MASLRVLHLNGNPVSGSLPAWAGSAGLASPQQLEQLLASHTQLAGTLPSQLGALPRLQHLLADHTAISGTVPTQLGLCADLAMASL
eukprot:5375665-Prymnesium_polylepis.1